MKLSDMTWLVSYPEIKPRYFIQTANTEYFYLSRGHKNWQHGSVREKDSYGKNQHSRNLVAIKGTKAYTVAMGYEK
jgi:hypothetical protein